MSALHKSLDETLAAIREQHQIEMQECKDRTTAAEVKAAILEKQLERANERAAASDRVAVKFVTQFAMVEKIFAEVKESALAAYSENEAQNTQVPVNKMAETTETEQ